MHAYNEFFFRSHEESTFEKIAKYLSQYGYADNSWHNDVSPKFSNADFSKDVWIDLDEQKILVMTSKGDGTDEVLFRCGLLEWDCCLPEYFQA